MAISKNALLTIGLTTFGISMVLDVGLLGLAFGAALYSGAMITLAMTAIIYGISEGNLNMKSSTRPSVTTHSQTFVPAPTPTPVPLTHTRHFEPVVPAPTPVPVTHTRHFEPAVPKSAAPVVHTRHFEPAVSKSAAPAVHTRHFEPAVSKSAAPAVHTRHFEPAAPAKGFTPGFVAAKTSTTTRVQSNVNPAAVVRTRTFVPN